MIREGHEHAKMFVGTEVEHTPAYGKKTLFVIGVIDASTIRQTAEDNKCDHIYFGANMSFPYIHTNNADVWKEWEEMICALLELKYTCTLDIDVSCVEGLVEGPLVEFTNFIPMISVKIPYTQLLGYNATVKIDDRDFAASNPGVWCHSLHELMDRKKFTDWSSYSQDKLI